MVRGLRKPGTKAHVGRIFEICVEKGSELPKGNPGRKCKGRVVFQGNDVKDENWNQALFQDLSSSPATMEAGKAADAYGLFTGHTVEQCDAEQAYIQSRLGGEPTWVRLPKERWPAEWVRKKFRDPVCPLILALFQIQGGIGRSTAPSISCQSASNRYLSGQVAFSTQC